MTPSGPSTAFILDEFAVPSPGQQLLDRFLIGYNADGEFRRPKGPVKVHFTKAVSNGALDDRVKDFGLQIRPSLKEAVANVQNVVIVLHGANASSSEEVISALPSGSRCFIYGLVGRDLQSTERLFASAAIRGVTLGMGTEVAHLFTLPELKLPVRGRATRALIAVQGAFPLAEAEGLEALTAILDSALAGQTFRSIQPLSGDTLWQTAYSADWRPLLAAAVSRSSTIHGDPDKDGRTQDIVGLHLLEKLAANPRGWIVDFANDFRLCLLVVDGAFSDINFAVEMTGAHRVSAQLLRSQSPMQEHFSNLAAALDDSPDHADSASRKKALFVTAILEKMRLTTPEKT